MTRLLSLLLVASPSLALADAPTATPQVSVVVRGTPAAAQAVHAGLEGATLGVTFQRVELPQTVSLERSDGSVEARLAAARRHYTNARFRDCQAALGEAALGEQLLGEGSRLLASRWVLWSIACSVGAGQRAAAEAQARQFATWGLEVPADVGSTNPDVEEVLARALRDIAERPRATLHLSSEQLASLAIDGRSGACTTPCAVDLPVGDHLVRAEAEGFVPQARSVRVEAAGATLSLTLLPAAPSLAAQQWLTRYGPAQEMDGPGSLRLLSVALRAPRLLVLSADATRLTGALAVDGAVVARAERVVSRPEELAEASRGLASDLLFRGRVVEPAPALYRRPAFWVGVGAAAVVGTVTTVLIVNRRVVSEVRYK
jgi:hypothetical protein